MTYEIADRKGKKTGPEEWTICFGDEESSLNK